MGLPAVPGAFPPAQVYTLKGCQCVGTVDDLFGCACSQVLESKPHGFDLSAGGGFHEDLAVLDDGWFDGGLYLQCCQFRRASEHGAEFVVPTEDFGQLNEVGQWLTLPDSRCRQTPTARGQRLGPRGTKGRGGAPVQTSDSLHPGTR